MPLRVALKKALFPYCVFFFLVMGKVLLAKVVGTEYFTLIGFSLLVKAAVISIWIFVLLVYASEGSIFLRVRNFLFSMVLFAAVFLSTIYASISFWITLGLPY